MRGVDRIEARARWLAAHVLPHEAGLRAWLRKARHADFDIDDIVQETYTRLVQVNDVSAVTNARAYVYRTAHSVVMDRLRRKQVVSFVAHTEIEAMASAIEELTPEDHARGRRELRELLDVVDELPAKTRRIFMLARVQGMSLRAVSQQTAIPESTVEKHVAKAMLHLMKRVADGGLSARDTSRKQSAQRPAGAGRVRGYGD